jgi:hypothetical protein
MAQVDHNYIIPDSQEKGGGNALFSNLNNVPVKEVSNWGTRRLPNSNYCCQQAVLMKRRNPSQEMTEVSHKQLFLDSLGKVGSRTMIQNLSNVLVKEFSILGTCRLPNSNYCCQQAVLMKRRNPSQAMTEVSHKKLFLDSQGKGGSKTMIQNLSNLIMQGFPKSDSHCKRIR